MKTIVGRLKVPNHKARDAHARLQKSLHILSQALKLRDHHRDVYVTEGEALTFTPRETATILAALREFQGEMREALASGDYDPEVGLPDSEHFREHKPLTPKEIDALCERLNFDG